MSGLNDIHFITRKEMSVAGFEILKSAQIASHVLGNRVFQEVWILHSLFLTDFHSSS